MGRTDCTAAAKFSATAAASSRVGADHLSPQMVRRRPLHDSERETGERERRGGVVERAVGGDGGWVRA